MTRVRAHYQGNPAFQPSQAAKPLQASEGDAGFVLLVDDEPQLLRALQRFLQADGHRVELASCANGVDPWLEDAELAVALVDLVLGGTSGLDILDRIVRDRPEVPVIVMTGHASIDSAVRCMQRGAFDYLAKPFENAHRVRLAVKQAFSRGQAVALGESLNELPLSLDAYEKLALERALREVDGDASAVARALGMGRSTLYRKLAKYGLSARQTACDPSDRNPPAFGAASPMG